MPFKDSEKSIFIVFIEVFLIQGRPQLFRFKKSTQLNM